LSLTFTFIASIMYGQIKNMGKLEIISTIVVKEQKHDAVMLQVRLSGFNNELDTVHFYKFYQNTPSLPFVFDFISLNKYKGSSVGLNYLIENESGDIIEAKEVVQPSFVNAKDEIDNTVRKEQVNKKSLKVKKVKIDSDKLHAYQLSKLMVSGNDTVVDLYPLLSSYHDLASGKYKIFLFYSFSDTISKAPPTLSLWDKDKPEEAHIYKGVIVSNKINLIVK
jgi:hypothetical protein